jgi:5-methylcytosine-specific restriction protein A
MSKTETKTKAALSNIDARSIELAVAEFDLIGRDNFLARYGFRKSNRFVLKIGQKAYDSKAIIGCAAQWTEIGRALGPKEFSGGSARIGRVFTRNGFRFVDTKA